MTKLGVSQGKSQQCSDDVKVENGVHADLPITPPVVYQPAPKLHKRPTRCMLGLIIAICAVCLIAVITFSVLFATGWSCNLWEAAPDADVSADTHHGAAQTQKMATLYSFDDIFNSSLRPRGFGGSFVGGGSIFVYRNDDGDLTQYDAATDEQLVIMENSVFEQLDTSTYFLSDDLQWVLLAYERRNLWRDSFIAKYKVFDRNAAVPGDLIDFPSDPVLVNQPLQLARWSSGSNKLAFVYNNNLYYQASPADQAIQITTDGDNTYVYNGISNYLYEEEVTQATEAHYWSTSGTYLVYARFDDTGISTMSMPMYGDKTNMYPDIVTFTYPKSGDLRDGAQGPNTAVQLFVVDTTSPLSPPRELLPPSELAGEERYYTRIGFRDDQTAIITWANRPFNRSIAMYCDMVTAVCTKNYDYSEPNGWYDLPPRYRFVSGGNSYVTLYPQSVDGQGTWIHLAEVALFSGENMATFLTDGADEVLGIAGYDSQNEIVYYYATGGDSTERHLFRVGTTASSQPAECMTCGVDPDCLYVSASFSGDGKYYILNCRGPGIPTYTLKGIDDAKNVVLEDNADVKLRLEDKILPTREFIDIPINGGYMAKAEVFFPPNYVPGSSTHRYLQYTYAGPNSKRVLKTFPIGGATFNWLMYLKSTHNVVVTSVDGRGTYGRGQEYKFEMYRKMGSVEIEDQIAGADYFKSQNYVDAAQNAAIFGWSYGGFSSALSVSNDPDALQCAVSVAPVTHFHYYDTAYTETHQGLASDNPSGYNDTDIMARAEGFRGKKLLLAHGTADDNVQLMHTMQLSKALIDADIDFHQLFYPDENHGINGASRHLYRAFTDFLLNDCWGA